MLFVIIVRPRFLETCDHIHMSVCCYIIIGEIEFLKNHLFNEWFFLVSCMTKRFIYTRNNVDVACLFFKFLLFFIRIFCFAVRFRLFCSNTLPFDEFDVHLFCRKNLLCLE